jgi:hypothetical protein
LISEYGVAAISAASCVRSSPGRSFIKSRERKLNSIKEPNTLRFEVAPSPTCCISRNSVSMKLLGAPTHSMTNAAALRNLPAKVDRSFASTKIGNSERSLTQITSRTCLVKSRFPYQSPKIVVGGAADLRPSALRCFKSFRVHRIVNINSVRNWEFLRAAPALVRSAACPKPPSA